MKKKNTPKKPLIVIKNGEATVVEGKAEIINLDKLEPSEEAVEEWCKLSERAKQYVMKHDVELASILIDEEY